MKKPTLREYLDGVREECNAATEGPWKPVGVGRNEAGLPVVKAEGKEIALCRANDLTTDDLNAICIAHSRTNVEVLLNMVEAVYDEAVLRKRLEALVPEGEE